MVSALEVWTVGSCVPGHQIWWEEEERHSRKGHMGGLCLWQCRVLGVFIFSDLVNTSVCQLAGGGGWDTAPRSTHIFI